MSAYLSGTNLVYDLTCNNTFQASSTRNPLSQVATCMRALRQVPAYAEHVVDGGTSVDDLGVFDEDLPTEPGAAPDEPRMEDNPFEEDAQREVKLKPLVTSTKVIRNILFGAELVKSLDTIWQWVPAVYQLLHPLHKELSGDANADAGVVSVYFDTNRYDIL